jgi:ferredoxin
LPCARAGGTDRVGETARPRSSGDPRQRELCKVNTTVRVDADRCQGCGACLDVCPEGAISLAGTLAVIDPQSCTGCQVCVSECSQAAIYMVIDTVARETADLSQLQRSPMQGEITTTGPPQRPGLLARVLRSPTVAGIAAFVGREIVPRAVDALLGGWDSRHSQAIPRAGDGDRPARAAQTQRGRRRSGRVRERRHGGGAGRGGKGR